MLRANGYTMVQHFRLFSISFLSFFFSFVVVVVFFFPCGWVWFCFVNLTEENFTGAQSRWLPRPRAGPSYECKTEITSERGCPECWPRPVEKGQAL